MHERKRPPHKAEEAVDQEKKKKNRNMPNCSETGTNAMQTIVAAAAAKVSLRATV